MAFGVDDAIGAGLGFLGDIFGGIGDQGFGAGERLQPEFASLQAALPSGMKFNRTLEQAAIEDMLYNSFMNSPITGMLNNLMSGKRMLAPFSMPQRMSGPAMPSPMPQMPVTPGGMMAPMGGAQNAFNFDYQSPSNSYPMGPGAGGQLSQAYNSPKGQLMTKAMQLRRMV